MENRFETRMAKEIDCLRCRSMAFGVRVVVGGAKGEWNKSKKDVAAVNRTRGSCMASTNFTTKPLRLIYEAYLTRYT